MAVAAAEPAYIRSRAACFAVAATVHKHPHSNPWAWVGPCSHSTAMPSAFTDHRRVHHDHMRPPTRPLPWSAHSGSTAGLLQSTAQ
jgi:hypothetical protein